MGHHNYGTLASPSVHVSAWMIVISGTIPNFHGIQYHDHNECITITGIPFLPSEYCAYKGKINDCVIMQAIMRANTRFGQD